MSFPMEKGDSSSNSMPTTDSEEKDGSTLAQEHIRRAQLKVQFHGTRKEEGLNIEAYVQQLKYIADSLAEIGSPISDPDLVLQLLSGLPSQYYSPFQKTISSKFPLPSFSETCSILSMYEKLLEEQTNNNSCKSTAYLEGGKEKLDTIVDMLSKLSSFASTAWDIWNVFGPSTTGTGNKNFGKGQAGRGRNNNKRGPNNFRNSRRK